MSFDWSQYLNLAHFLTGNLNVAVDDAAKLRSAISRAYYAVYNHAVQYMAEKYHVSNLGRDPHKYVQNWFEDSAIEEEQIIGEYLRRLKGRRVKADYEGQYIRLIEQTETTIQYAEKALKLLGK